MADSKKISKILSQFKKTPDNLLPALFVSLGHPFGRCPAGAEMSRRDKIKRLLKNKWDFSAISEIAEFFNFPKSHIWGVLSFYHIFEIGPAKKISRAKEKAAKAEIAVRAAGPLLEKKTGFKIFAKIKNLKPEEIIKTITDSGLTGRGGACFPAGKKWQAVLEASRNQGVPPVIICNAYEAEPDVFKDRILLEENPALAVEGILIAAKTLGAKAGYVYLNPYYGKALKKIRPVLKEAEKILPDFNLKIFLGGGNYICGEETALLESIEGKRGEPRQKPPFPVERGLFGRPTLINNTETFANIPLIFSGKFKNTKLFCLTGKAAKNPGVYELSAETKIGDLVFNFGGAKKEKIGFIQTGGFGGKILRPEELKNEIIASGAAAVCVEPRNKKLIEISRERVRFFASESCGKCAPCREGTFQISEILEKKNLSAKDKKRIDDLIFALKEASFCAFGPMAAAPAIALLRRSGRAVSVSCLMKKA